MLGPEQAFPGWAWGAIAGKDIKDPYPGMDLIDWFAGRALTGIISNNAFLEEADKDGDQDDYWKNIAQEAYRFAAAMMEERKKE